MLISEVVRMPIFRLDIDAVFHGATDLLLDRIAGEGAAYHAEHRHRSASTARTELIADQPACCRTTDCADPRAMTFNLDLLNRGDGPARRAITRLLLAWLLSLGHRSRRLRLVELLSALRWLRHR